MATVEINVPDIGESGDVEVIEVHVKAGDQIELEAPLITLESDKAAMDIPASQAGTVAKVLVKVGDKVSEGAQILLLDSEAAEAPADAPAETPKEAPKEESKAGDTATASDSGGDKAAAKAKAPSAPAADQSDFSRVHASPVIRALAREKGVDLTSLTGTGQKGRITRQDVESHVSGGSGSMPAGAQAGLAAVGPVPTVDFDKYGETQLSPLSKIKRLTAQNLHRSWVNIPHVTHNDEADITETEAFRKSLKQRAENAGVRVTLLGFFMKAVAAALKEFPAFNSSLDATGENLILKNYINIGIAVDTPNGLVVPVIRDVDKKNLFTLAAELSEISVKARDRKLKVADMQGGCFTISSLGGIGGTSFTPIINAPEVAILGLTRSKLQPVPDGDSFKFRLMQPMSLSYDHRVIDGAEAARFVKRLGELVSDLRLIML